MAGYDPTQNPAYLLEGIPFSFSLLLILGTHEMGHYVAARIHGVPATLPLFIPGPPVFIGTFGAVIRMKGPILRKHALFDVGVSGPIVGFIFAIGAVVVGLHYSEVVSKDGIVGINLGTPMLFEFLTLMVIGDIPDDYDIVLHPIAFAGWVGFFITALNLIPIGQLDGGHVAYAMYGRRQPRISAIIVTPILLYLGTLGVLSDRIPWLQEMPGSPGWPGWLVWAFLPLLFGLRHPPVLDHYIPLDRRRTLIGWLAVGIFIVSFVPVPFQFP